MQVDLFSLPVPNIGRIAADGLVHARDLLGYLFARFFTPQDIARQIVVKADVRADFIRWLRIVEDMLRRVLFIEASAIATSLPPPTPPRARTSCARKPGPTFDLDDINTWRPSFRMTPPASRAGVRTARRIKQKPRSLVKTRPLALRMQALLEALHDPHRFIQRLARRLRSGLDRFRHLATFEPCFHGRADPILRHLSAECAPRFTDSS